MTQAEVREIKSQIKPSIRKLAATKLLDYYQYARRQGKPLRHIRGLHSYDVTCPACNGECYLMPGDLDSWCPLCGALDGKVPTGYANEFARLIGAPRFVDVHLREGGRLGERPVFSDYDELALLEAENGPIPVSPS